MVPVGGQAPVQGSDRGWGMGTMTASVERGTGESGEDHSHSASVRVAGMWPAGMAGKVLSRLPGWEASR